MISRRTMVGSILAMASAPACARTAKAAKVDVYKSPACGCCGAWVDHIRSAGMAVVVHDLDDVSPIAAKAGVPDEARSCHTAIVDGYFVEGHVPVVDIRRLLKERPKARGIAVPGMPIGSPGMEQGQTKQSYDTLVVDRRGVARVFASHNRPSTL